MKEYYLGIDIGTYESRGMLIDENMIPVADCSVTHGMDHPQEGWFEHDADKVWWGDFCKLCRLLLEKSNIRSDEIIRYRDWETDRKSTRLNSSHSGESRMPSSA